MQATEGKTMREAGRRPGMRGLGAVAAVWGLSGFVLLLGRAIYGISPYVLDLTAQRLNALHWASLIVWSVFMVYSEGYRGFQKQYAPRFAARLRWLRRHPSPLRALLAPLFCMGFFGTTRKRKIVVYVLTAFIVLLVLGVRLLPPPWRGIIDVGVILGLSWGLLSVLWYSWQAAVLDRDTGDAEVVLDGGR